MASGVGFGFRLKEFFSVEKGALLKIAIVIVVLHYLVWNVAGLGAYVHKQLFGAQRTEATFLENVENIDDFEDYYAGNQVNIRGYLVNKTFKKKYSIAGTFLSKASNADFLQFGPLKLLKEEKEAYMEISPNNITVVWGPNINKALKECDFVQVTDTYVKCPRDYDEAAAHINNYHIIPASRAVENGLNALPRRAKKEIYLEGFLIDWDFARDDKKKDDLRFKSALRSGEMRWQILDGDAKIRKNFQLYLTRMIYDGYEFK